MGYKLLLELFCDFFEISLNNLAGNENYAFPNT